MELAALECLSMKKMQYRIERYAGLGDLRFNCGQTRTPAQVPFYKLTT